ncbi:type II toxin-antitoxin system HicA family toxin [bacterium]|nr:type II toxin-antitoxin system HicA family toxin [bacterium]
MANGIPVKSGIDVLKTFHRAKEIFGITFKRHGKGSHVILHNRNCNNFSVPLHPELKRSTLNSLIQQSGMTKEDFLQYDP